MKILVTGYPRSGTRYMSELLKAYGYDVGHERFGRDGISSWMHAVDTPTVPHGDARNGRQYDLTIHVVRHPLHVIASMTTVSRVSLNFLARHAPMTGKTFAARIARNWIAWNRMITADFRVQVENAAETLHDYFRLNDLPVDLRGELPPININSREHAPFVWRQFIRSTSPELAADLATTATQYGYDVRQK